MNRREFNLAATLGLAAGTVAVPATSKAAVKGRDFYMDLLGHSTRMVGGEALSSPNLAHPQYTLSSKCSLKMHFRADGSGSATGKSLRILSGLIDQSLLQAAIPMTETATFGYDFTYSRSGETLTIMLNDGSWKGQYLTGPSQSKDYAIRLVQPSSAPFLEGYLHRQNERVEISTPEILTAVTTRSDGAVTTSAFTIMAQGVLAR